MKIEMTPTGMKAAGSGTGGLRFAPRSVHSARLKPEEIP
jgi:hypothetical protein